jgi:hypothetical protein
MVRANERTALTAVVVAILLGFLVATLSLSPTARIVPLIVLAPTLVLAALRLVMDLAPMVGSSARDVQQDPPDDAPSTRRMEIAIVGWIVALLGLVLLLGLLVALPSFTLLYTRFQARESRRTAISLAVGLLALLYGVFRVGLRVRLYEGLIPPLLGL